MNEWSPNWVHLVDVKRKSQVAFAAWRLPTYLVLDAEGRLVGETWSIDDVPSLLRRAERR